MLIGIYFGVYMKMPREGNKDNFIVEFLNEKQIFINLTFEEIVRYNVNST